MLVKNWMTRQVITIDAEDSMQHAMNIMKEQNIRMLPVLSKGKLAGVVSETDIKRASASDATTLDIHEILYLISKIKAKDIMAKNPITVPEDLTVEETAEIFMAHKISGVPVVDSQGKVTGIITRDDLFKVIMSLSGFGKRGVQFAFQVEDRSGSIKEITDILRGYGGRIASILGSYERAAAGSRIVYIRVYALDREQLPSLIDELKGKTDLIYYVDHRENKREIFRDLPA